MKTRSLVYALVAGALSLALCLSLLTDTAVAQEPVGGGDVEYAGGGLGKVTFSHALHQEKGNACTDCHPDPFAMSKGSTKVTMVEVNAGRQCGTCHKEGGKSFNAATECMRCHAPPG